MNLEKVFRSLTAVFILLYAPALLSAQDQIYKLSWSPQSKVVLKGNSSLHPYNATATSLSVTGTVQLSEPANSLHSLLTGRIQQLQVVIPVAGLKSTKKELDKNLHQDLKGEKYPDIMFRLTDFQMPPVAPVGSSLPMTLKGNLAVAGVEKPVAIEARVTYQHDGIHVAGSTPLLMTDFGIKPRKFMLMMKVDNQVVVEFDFVINAKEQILN